MEEELTTEQKRIFTSLLKNKKTCHDLVECLIIPQLEGLIRTGKINPKGKSLRSLLKEAGKIKTRPNVLFMEAIDYTEDILHEARIFKKKRNYHFACIFYAAWAEHWVNGVIADECEKLNIGEKHAKEIIRDISIKNKYSWFLMILKLPAISEKILHFLDELIQTRNAFIHYKWCRKNIDDVDWIKREKESYKRKISNFEKVVKYLKKYEERHLLKNYKIEVLKNIE